MTKHCTHEETYADECILCFGFYRGVKDDSLLHFAEFVRRRQTRSYARKRCQSCGGRADGYMLKNSLWKQITKTCKSRFLCLGCVETKLGRALKLCDFTDCLLNQGVGGFDARSYIKYSKAP